MVTENKLRSVIQRLLEQRDLRLKRELINITCRLKMEKEAHVPDTLTRIRVLPTVSVVGQTEPVLRSGSDTALEIYVKFLPKSGSDYNNLKALAKLIKSLPGIKIVTILTLNNRKVTYQGQSIVV